MVKLAGKVRKGTFDHRQIWRHNALMGQCKRATTAMQAVYDAETTTDECKALASKIEGQLFVLSSMLKTRRDHVYKRSS